MALVLNEEQVMLKDAAAGFLAEKATVAHLRALRDSGSERGFDDDVWREMVEMGWTGILSPEQYGGSDLGFLTFGVVLEQLGRQLTASPLFASALVGASAVMLGGNDAQKQLLLPSLSWLPAHWRQTRM